jgi:hypothetical protein
MVAANNQQDARQIFRVPPSGISTAGHICMSRPICCCRYSCWRLLTPPSGLRPIA